MLTSAPRIFATTWTETHRIDWGTAALARLVGHVDLAIGFNRLMATDAEQAIREKFGPQIGACERLYEYAKGLTTSWRGRLIENTAEGLILALFSRSLDTFMAAVRLASVGYGAQASMLNRSRFEDMIDVHWIATEPEAAEQRYRDHHQHPDAARRCRLATSRALRGSRAARVRSR
jgi:hypothetical protein